MTIGLVGASSVVGTCAISILSAQNRPWIGFSRASPVDGAQWRLLTKRQPHQGEIEYWINFANIWSFSDRCEAIRSYGTSKIIAISSTSRFTKAGSGDAREMETARLLAEGEEAFVSWCDRNGIGWIILRPTMIYGTGRDRNIRDIAAIIRRFGFFPIFGSGLGKRQPIHAQDLAQACVSVLASGVSGRAYNLSGGEVVSYREMVARVAATMGRRPILPTIPMPLFKAACLFLTQSPRFAHWTPQMAERMNMDMAFDHSDATKDFGFSPRAFTVSREDLRPD